MPNPQGHVQTLQASHPGNLSALRSGVFSRSGRVLEPCVRELADAILALPHASELDELGALEIARLAVLIDRLDAELAERGFVATAGRDRTGLAKLRATYSRRLFEALSAFGMTPRSRAELAATLASGGLGEQIRRRLEELEEDG